jgi:hypothetical protein
MSIGEAGMAAQFQDNASLDPERIAGAVMQEPALAGCIDQIEPLPHAPERVFRVRWLPDNTRCVLKVGVGDLEALWMPAISERSDDIVPRVRASGISLGDLNLAWLMMADLPHRGRSNSLGIARGTMRAAARFQQEARSSSLPTYPIDGDFLHRYAQEATNAGCPGPAAEVIRRIEFDDTWLRSLGDYVVGHGDVHFWNAVAATPHGPWRLIDPIPRSAHWAWDAAYAQMASGVPQTPDLISILAEERQRLQLPVSDIVNLDTTRAILLGWTSMMWWALLPARRSDLWWADQVQRHIQDLARLALPPPVQSEAEN